MSEKDQPPFHVGVRVIVEFSARWTNVVTFKEGVVARLHKNNNFRIQFDGADKPDDQQWHNPSSHFIQNNDTFTAHMTGSNYGARCHLDSGTTRKDMQRKMDMAKLRVRFEKVRRQVEALRMPKGDDEAEYNDMLGRVGALEKCVTDIKDPRPHG